MHRMHNVDKSAEKCRVEHNNPRWYIMTDESSRVHDPENADKPRGHTFSWSWHLPVGLTCEHCVVQCTWPSHTHCTFPCEREVCGWYADQYNHIMRPERQSNYKFKTPFCEAGLNPAPGQAPQVQNLSTPVAPIQIETCQFIRDVFWVSFRDHGKR